VHVAIIDVGSNTVRLLVAIWDGNAFASVHEERAYLGLGADLERLGRIPNSKLTLTAEVARRYARTARRQGADIVEVIVTAPGRQSANADVLVASLAGATGATVRVLTAEEEGRLAFEGAVSAFPSLPQTVAVCDVGGGSTELLVGTRTGGPAWCRSIDLGSQRLTSRFFVDDPPDKRSVAAARAEAEGAFMGLTAPLPMGALATGGSAKALRRLVGATLGADELEEAIKILRRRPAARIADAFGIDELRARTLIGGAILLLEAHRRFGVPFVVARAGLREGAALGLVAEVAAA
jgi:exopolyphosphatase / guanosine-5'-triphosphate,3'-diphosphate pyrophosphatase